MRTVWLTGVVGFIIMAVAVLSPATEPAANKPGSDNKLVGTWKLASGRYGGQDVKFPEGTTMLKHITPAQFMWATYDQEGKVTRAAGGSITFTNDDFEETPSYGIGDDFDVVKGQTHTFKGKVEGNKLYQNGKLKSGLTIEEVWERIERK